MAVRDWIDPFRLYNPSTPAGRLMFWWGFWGFPAVIFVLLGLFIVVTEPVFGSIDESPIFDLIDIPISFATVISSILIGIRRLKDLGKSGWNILILLIPFVNFIFGFYLFFGPGLPRPEPPSLALPDPPPAVSPPPEQLQEARGRSMVGKNGLDKRTLKSLERIMPEFLGIVQWFMDNSVFEYMDWFNLEKRIAEAEMKIAGAAGCINAMTGIWPDGTDVFTRFQAGINVLQERNELARMFASTLKSDIPEIDKRPRLQEITTKNRELLMIAGTQMAEAADIFYEKTGVPINFQFM